MSNIELIKELRDSTNLPFKDIQKAVQDANGDRTKALEILKAKGATMADKKADRSTQEGIVVSYIHGNNKVGVMLELFCETDFVARNPLFPELAKNISMHVAAMNPVDSAELMKQEYIKDPSVTIEGLISSVIAQLGENIKVGKFIRYSI